MQRPARECNAADRPEPESTAPRRPARFGTAPKAAVLPALLFLAACGTPQQQCINGVTGNIRVLDGLIAETEANLARGYALQDSTTFVPQWQMCGWGQWGNAATLSTGMCWVDEPVTVQRPVAIDPDQERAKLAGLKQSRAEQAAAAAPAIANCQAQFPE